MPIPTPWIIIGAIVIVAAIVIFIIKKKNNDEDADEYDGDYDVKITPDTLNRYPRKKALLVGINKYDPKLDNDLRGCVNDTEVMYGLLINKFKFDPANVRVLVDERATKKGILERLEWLLDKYKIVDELIF